jgi:hypothetical protein
MLRESSHSHSGNTDSNLLGYVAVFFLPTLIMEVADSPETSVNIYKLLTYPSNAVGSPETQYYSRSYSSSMMQTAVWFQVRAQLPDLTMLRTT